MKPEATSITVDLAGGKQLTFETGKLAKQAHGAAVVRLHDNVVLATAVANADPREGIDFFPLTVDYREYTYAGGRIPGGFIKREGRPSEREILTSRQIDRPVRPLFPEGFKCETQVIAFVLSADTDNDPDVMGINGASCALTLSDIPFMGPIGAVRVGLVNGSFVVNPTYTEMRDSLLNIMVVGTADGIVMIESGAKEVKEETVVDAIEFGHTEVKKICAAINELRAKVGKPKRKVEPVEFDEAYYNDLKKRIGADLADRLDTQKHPKSESYTLVKDLKKELLAAIPEEDEDARVLQHRGRAGGRGHGEARRLMARRPRDVRGRLRRRGEPGSDPRADGKRHRLRPHRRDVRRDHTEGGRGRAVQLPLLHAVAASRDAAHRRVHRALGAETHRRGRARDPGHRAGGRECARRRDGQAYPLAADPAAGLGDSPLAPAAPDAEARRPHTIRYTLFVPPGPGFASI